MTTLTRRHLVLAGTATAAGAVMPRSVLAATRAASDAEGNIERQTPIYRTQLGSAELTIVSDGTIDWAPTDLLDVPESQLESFLERLHQPTDKLRLQLNAMLVDLNGRRVLIDAGDAGKWQPTGGRLPANLQSAGIDPESIDTVILTHLHPDHLWGITDPDNERLIFPNAEYIVAEPELAFWDDPDLPDRMPSEVFRRVAETNLAHLARIRDRINVVGTSEADVTPGVTLLPTPGHTPGHVSLLIESDGDSLMSTGDLVGDPLIGFERPHWDVTIDWDPEQGTRSRLAFLDRAASEGARVFGFHLPWPGFGYVARDGEAFRWIQEEWVW